MKSTQDVTFPNIIFLPPVRFIEDIWEMEMDLL